MLGVLKACVTSLNQTSKLDFFSTSSIPLAYHLIAGPGALALELRELSPVMDSDKQLPDGQECDPDQEDTAHHGQEDGCGIGGSSTLWRGPGGGVNGATGRAQPHTPPHAALPLA